MAENEGSHDPGLLVIDELGWALVDLASGDVARVPCVVDDVFARLGPSTRPRTPVRAVVAPMPTDDPRQRVSYRAMVPVVLRLDHGRVLAWSDELRAHVTLDGQMLEAITSLAAAGTSSPDALDDQHAGRVLVALGLARADECGDLAAGDADGSGGTAPVAPADGEEALDFVTGAQEVDDDKESTSARDDPTESGDSPLEGSPAVSTGWGVSPSRSLRSPATRLPSVWSDLPRGPFEKVHVVAFRIVGRARRLSRRLTGGASSIAEPDQPLVDPAEGTSVDDPPTVDVHDDAGPASRGDVESHTAPGGFDAELPTRASSTDEFLDVSAASEAADDEAVLADGDDPVAAVEPVSDGRIPVIPLYTWGAVSDDQGYGELVEPSLSIGMLFAAARCHDDGALNLTYDLRRIRPDADAVFEEWARAPVPAIFAFSDYLWNVDRHLDFSRRVKELSPESICIHGGPSVPKYVDDADRFFADHPAVDVAVRGEGEVTFVEILDRLDGDIGPGALERLEGVRGVTFRSRRPSGDAVVRNDDRPRLDQLDVLPSPYLTGEFDELLTVEWRSASVESNRGCPYGCTFCDWGSATLARIRKFDLDRVRAELDWIMEHAGPSELHVADANFGIFKRDVDIARHVADLYERFGSPYALTISLAKNTVKYSQRIIEILVRSGVSPITASSAVQTFDDHTLEVVRRKNIKVETYEKLAVTFAEEGIPLVTDLLMGLPGATIESFKLDLQHCFDREVTPRTMEIIMLPNSPMNEPSYRAEHELVVDEHGVVVGASSYSRDDYERMKRLRLIYRAADHFGVLRHVLRYLQWDHGIPAIEVMDAIDLAVSEDPTTYPLLAFMARVMDLYTVPPVAWAPFYDEVADFLELTYGIPRDAGLDTVLEVQQAVMPTRGRTYPYEVSLSHDFIAYRSNNLAVARGEAIRRRLGSFPAASVVVGDPGGVTTKYLKRNDFPGRRSATTGNLFWVGYDWELDSPLVRHLATNLGRFDRLAAA